ncbi:MAG TPA: LysR substrate-binding domain-containing protein [Beijerinckiaceae bacterium]|nr:LysR substrate-binding domain-containing protein [Beijerinckiaceae bacterium]
MKLHQLRDLVAIAEHGSLRGAARHLGIAQPTLTRSLSELERQLGAPLFGRRSRGMVPTPLGQAFIRRATAILNDVRRAQDEFEQLRGNAVGTVTVGLSIAAHLALLPQALRLFRRQYPKVRLRIIEGFYPTLQTGLQDGSVDFYIGPDAGVKLPSVLQKEILFSGLRVVLCRARHPLANATALADLKDAEWITTSITSKAEDEIGVLFKRYGLPEPILALQSQSALTLITCLANSDLLSMVPAQWTNSPFSKGVLTTIKVKEELAAAPLIVVMRSELPLSPAGSFLLDMMKRSVDRLRPES